MLTSVTTTAGMPAAPSAEQEAASRLAATGIAALDARLGGLVRGRHYLIAGAPGAGKSSAALHFLGCGLAAGERCLILTQDDPADLIAQAEFLGYDFRAAAEQDRLVVLQFRLDFSRNYARSADPSRALAELGEHVAEHRPDRFLIDSLSPFLEGGRASEEALGGVPEFLDSLECTTYLVVPGDLGDSYFSRIYDRVISGSGGIFHFEVSDGQIRELTIRKLRQPIERSEPLRFVLRPGVGIVEHDASRRLDELPDEVRRRVVLLNRSAALPYELRVALERAYDVVGYDSVERAFAELVSGRHGALIIALDPRDAEPVFNLARELRRSGNGAPILFVSPSHGLRGSTRARGLRAGGDDFLTDALSPEEFLERIEVARARGHRRAVEADELEPLFVQPSLPDGSTPLLALEKFREVVAEKITRQSHPFFALVVLRPLELDAAAAWRILADCLRVREGDLGAATRDGRVVLYLHDVRRRHVDQLLERITQAHPALGAAAAAEVFSYPADRLEIEARLGISAGPTGHGR